ncbi:uncharacterized protein LOC128554108 [Mercenaria mercenaria]|uniref:uncharacterized protein LOC128554108 n=1 Tax=Mercenaria mercenaria TaxID=6596 RepID=UPI00234F9A76|nr:uncharacterized protein LOC128554108 [Mercenaria mercenaria]
MTCLKLAYVNVHVVSYSLSNILLYFKINISYDAGPSSADEDSAFERPEDQTRKVFRAIDEIANRYRVKHMLQLLHEPLGESVLKAAKQQNVDMIIIGRKHGKSNDLGATTNFIAFQSDVPVLIYKYIDTESDNNNSKDYKRQRSESFSDKVKAMLKIH